MTFQAVSTLSSFKQQIYPTDLQRQKKSTSQISFCRVCGDRARYIHYGAFVCPSCKTFFRRHASYDLDLLRCHFAGDCAMTTESRRICSACRFRKCLAVGMSSDFIRKEDQRRTHASKLIAFTPPRLPTLDLLNSDRSSLLITDWRLLSNVTHAFDNFVSIDKPRQVIERVSTQPLHLPLDTSELLTMFTKFYISAESFIGCSADFQILTVNEKCSLYQRNLHGLLHLYATFIYRFSGMFDRSCNDRILISMYGYDTFLRTKRIALQLDDDVVMMKLFLFILAFSSNTYMIEEHEDARHDSFSFGTYRLFGSQNVYVEVLWKYMLYRYTYNDACIRFARLIKHMLDFMIIAQNAYQTSEVHQNFIDNVSESIEQTVIINDNTVVPLWGKS